LGIRVPSSACEQRPPERFGGRCHVRARRAPVGPGRRRGRSRMGSMARLQRVDARPPPSRGDGNVPDSEAVPARRYAGGLDLCAGAESITAPRGCREQKSRFASLVVQPLTHARCWMMSFTGGRNRSMGLDTIKEFQQPSKSHRIAPRLKVIAPTVSPPKRPRPHLARRPLRRSGRRVDEPDAVLRAVDLSWRPPHPVQGSGVQNRCPG
jgi:hypothetical protein